MKRFIVILLAGFAVFFGAATTAEAGHRGYRTYHRSYCGPTYYRSYYGPSYYRSYYGGPSYYYRSYDYCAPRYYYRPYSYGYCAPRYYYPHHGFSISLPGIGFHICR